MAGIPWDPTNIRPHSYDYKTRVRVDRQDGFRQMLKAAWHDPGSVHFLLREIVSAVNVDRLAYLDSQEKTGLFLQASCVITDGASNAAPRELLCCVRSACQFHNESIPRYLKGLSWLWGTVLHDDDFIGGDTGNVPHALFNSVESYSPFAIFARKLLLPEPNVDARFLGIGFNLTIPGREYVHFVWHVRCRRLDNASIVPFRERREGSDSICDIPKRKQISAALLRQAPQAAIDQAVLRYLLGQRQDNALEMPRAGLIVAPRFERLPVGGTSPAKYFRESVIFDLLVRFQQDVHSRRIRFRGKERESEMRDKLDDALNDPKDGVSMITAQERRTGRSDRSPRTDIWCQLKYSEDKDSRVHQSYLIECKRGHSPAPTKKALAQIMDYASMTRKGPHEHQADALFLIWLFSKPTGIYELNGLQPIHDDPPVYLMRVCTNPLAPAKRLPIKRVVHALIPVRDKSGRVKSLLFTQRRDDECPRLPGGKRDQKRGAAKSKVESPEHGLRRELREELGIELDQIEKMKAVRWILGGGVSGLAASRIFTVEQCSPSTGFYTDYRMCAFLVKLSPSGVAALGKSTQARVHGIHTRLISDWCADGFGFDPVYARAVNDQLTPEILDAYAIDEPRLPPAADM